ncbi:MAG: hypothetical protein L0H63_07890 [Nitrococcus sp.]|nr:hypothetical protein [Nitrococcus sp.]
MSTIVRAGAGRKRLMSKQIQGLALGTLLALPLTALATTTQPGPVPASVDVFAPFSVISRDEMARLRGGFDLAGMRLKFGVEMLTQVDGLKMVTNFKFTETGIASSTTTRQLAQTAANAQGARVAGTAAQVDVSGLRDQIRGRLVLNDANGLTEAFHLITKNGFGSTVLSAANNRDIAVRATVRVDFLNHNSFSQMTRNQMFTQRLSTLTRVPIL